MRRAAIVLPLIIVALFNLIGATAHAEGGPPAPDATPGAVGITGIPLGGLEPSAAPGYRLEVVELTWEPGAYATRHFHPTALITCVQEGALGFVLEQGTARVTRGGTADAPGTPEPLALGTEVVLEPRDCITFDELAAHMEHTGWNASEGTTVLWEARLLDPNQPFTIYVDAMGTPIP
jgi:quercetin dioxygenase-like cupin family protein